LYGTLRDSLGHFPLQHFWGPLANIKSTAWIADSLAQAVPASQPRFIYAYLPHLDYAAQKSGPASDGAQRALGELDEVLARLVAKVNAAYDQPPLWIVASEYTISPVSHVAYPNRVLRQAGLLSVDAKPDGEHLDLVNSRAWALVDHQFAHVFVQNEQDIGRVADLFRGHEGIADVVVGDDRRRLDLDHPRSGEVILVSRPDSWQAYYWWLDDAKAPGFARTVDIHRKPGYDPVELHVDMATRSIPLDATLVKGSHGAPATEASQRGIVVSSQKGVFDSPTLADIDICPLVLRQFGI
jgi:predicted AlkP superfamily pyrophosphatase or phosphodiesterase